MTRIIIFVVLLFGSILVEGRHEGSSHELTHNCLKDKSILWPDKNDESAFFVCDEKDNIVNRLCPPNSVFDFHKQQCMQSRIFIESKDLQLDYSPSCLESELHFLWPHPEVPEDFFICTSVGVSQRNTCPEGTFFVFIMQMCVVETATTTTTEIPIDRSPECTINDLHLTWPDPIYPEIFYVCTGVGQSEERRCPDGMVFVFMVQMCVEGNESTTTSMTETSPGIETTEITKQTLPEGTREDETTESSTDDTTFEDTTLEETTVEDTTIEDTTIEDTTITSTEESTERPETTTEGLQTAPTIAFTFDSFY